LLPPALTPPSADKLQTGAVQLLAVLQKEGRLLDFLQENIDGYDDAQVGAAVRTIHSSCCQVLQDYIGLEPVIAGEEEAPVTIEPGFDPFQIRLIGNVTGNPPFSGVLKHHGWRATGVTLPQPAAGQDPLMITPAEVELP